MTSYVSQQVQELYSSFDQNLVANLSKIYRPDIVFQDPLHRIEGIDNLTRYFEGMLAGLAECQFEFNEVIENHSLNAAGVSKVSSTHALRIQQAVLFWTMRYRHKKLAGGKLLSISGNSHIKYQEKIFYHRDYFDAGAMLYEHLPMMGYAIKLIKKRTGI